MVSPSQPVAPQLFKTNPHLESCTRQTSKYELLSDERTLINTLPWFRRFLPVGTTHSRQEMTWWDASASRSVKYKQNAVHVQIAKASSPSTCSRTSTHNRAEGFSLTLFRVLWASFNCAKTSTRNLGPNQVSCMRVNVLTVKRKKNGPGSKTDPNKPTCANFACSVNVAK